MNKPDFMSMNRTELRKYIIHHSEDVEAFQIYVDRFQSTENDFFPAPQTIDDLSNFPELIRQHQQRTNQA